MHHAALGYNGAVSAPHRSAALAGRDVLRDGGTAIKAMVAAHGTACAAMPFASLDHFACDDGLLTIGVRCGDNLWLFFLRLFCLTVALTFTFGHEIVS